MKELLESLIPILGELLSVLVVTIIAWLKRFADKKTIKKQLTKVLQRQGTPQAVITAALDIVDQKSEDFV